MKFIIGLIGAAAVLAPVAAHAETVDLRLSYTVPASESGTKAIDTSGNHNTGVLKGEVTRLNGHYKFHRLGHSGTFDRIVTPDDLSLHPGFHPFSYSVRVKISPHAVWENNEMAIIRHGDSDNGTGGNYKMEVRKISSGAVVASCVMHDGNSHAGYVRGTPGLVTVADGHFHTITCARVANTVTLTIDGVTATGQTKGTLGSLSGHAQLLIGCQIQRSGTKREQFVGKMDDITIATTS